MAELLSVATTVAEHRVCAAETKRFLSTLLPPAAAARFGRLVDASGNETRYGVLPLAALRRLDTVEARGAAYREHAVRLGEGVARDALTRAGVDADQVTAIVGVSSTGHLMPTLETHLINRLRLRPTCRRVPLTQLGCAGGVAALGLAGELARADRSAVVLIVSVELPSLSLPAAEPSATDVLASIQFGDGAAAAVVSGADTARGPALLASGSALVPDSIERDGVLLTTAGLRLAVPRGLPALLRANLGDRVDQFLTAHGLRRTDITFWALHPRNPELLQAAADSLALPAAALAAPRAVWQRAGNLISSAIFHTLRELHDSAPPPAGALGMTIAYGAGFSCELALLRSAGWLAARPSSDGAADRAM